MKKTQIKPRRSILTSRSPSKLSEKSLKLKKQTSSKHLPKNKDMKCINYLWVVFFVKKFVDILKFKTVESKLKKLESYQQAILDDLVFFPNGIETNKTHLNNPIYKYYVYFFFFCFFLIISEFFFFIYIY